mmetsp:Transcript_19681/g.25442  ORF Transcript_19681/g.25442 Transcript_19681/m.25442 type:complete len:129 (-) Transcript_19681:106-492(-)
MKVCISCWLRSQPTIASSLTKNQNQSIHRFFCSVKNAIQERGSDYEEKRKPKRKSNPFLRAGVPLICLVTGGSYLLSTFVQGKVEAKDAKQKSLTNRQFDLEEEYKTAMKELNVEESYIPKRIPRPED